MNNDNFYNKIYNKDISYIDKEAIFKHHSNNKLKIDIFKTIKKINLSIFVNDGSIKELISNEDCIKSYTKQGVIYNDGDLIKNHPFIRLNGGRLLCYNNRNPYKLLLYTINLPSNRLEMIDIHIPSYYDFKDDTIINKPYNDIRDKFLKERFSKGKDYLDDYGTIPLRNKYLDDYIKKGNIITNIYDIPKKAVKYKYVDVDGVNDSIEKYLVEIRLVRIIERRNLSKAFLDPLLYAFVDYLPADVILLQANGLYEYTFYNITFLNPPKFTKGSKLLDEKYIKYCLNNIHNFNTLSKVKVDYFLQLLGTETDPKKQKKERQTQEQEDKLIQYLTDIKRKNDIELYDKQLEELHKKVDEENEIIRQEFNKKFKYVLTDIIKHKQDEEDELYKQEEIKKYKNVLTDIIKYKPRIKIKGNYQEEINIINKNINSYDKIKRFVNPYTELIIIKPIHKTYTDERYINIKLINKEKNITSPQYHAFINYNNEITAITEIRDILQDY